MVNEIPSLFVFLRHKTQKSQPEPKITIPTDLATIFNTIKLDGCLIFHPSNLIVLSTFISFENAVLFYQNNTPVIIFYHEHAGACM